METFAAGDERLEERGTVHGLNHTREIYCTRGDTLPHVVRRWRRRARVYLPSPALVDARGQRTPTGLATRPP